MQEWLDNNNISVYSTHNENKTVIAERFIRTLKAKIYKKITANDSKTYLKYLNKLVDQYNCTYHHSIGGKSINDNYSVLIEKIKTNSKNSKFEVNDRVRITNDKNIFSKGDAKNLSRKVFISDSVLKTNPWTCKI